MAELDLYEANDLVDEDEIEVEDLLDTDPTQDVVTRSLERALRYHEEIVEPDLVQATQYYNSEAFGNEVEGKSAVVTSDVRDATLSQMPSLLRIFFGSENPVELRGRGPGDQAIAELQTKYLRYVVSEDNDGFLQFHSAMKDALARGLGIWKWWWDDAETVKESVHTGLTPEDVLALASEPTVESAEIDEETGEIRVRRRLNEGRARFVAVPPEEFIFDPGTRSLDTSAIVAHVREVPASDLIAQGIDRDLVKRAIGRTRHQHADEMPELRNEGEGDYYKLDEATLDPSQRPVMYAEAYARIDADDDGISELRYFQCVGDDFKIANGKGEGEIVDEVPFATLTPEPEPHTLKGLSNFDQLRDIQLVKSQVLRSTLDSLSEAVDPRTEVVSGEVNMHDLLNPETSKFVRVTRPGMMREVKHEFVGEDTLPVLQYFDEQKENRTGQSKAAMGLDADSLQSSTKAAVAATLSASQQRIEMIARIFAETGVKRLFRGLFRLLVRHQDQPRVVRLAGHYVQVDPRHWDATMDIEVAVGLGAGTNEEKVVILQGVLERQEMYMQHNSPLVSWVEIRNTLGRLLELAGIRNSEAYFKPFGEQEAQAAAQQAAQQPQQPDPAQQLVEVEKAKLQMDQMKLQMQVQTDQAKMELERWKAQQEDDRERDRMAREFEIERLKLEMEHQMKTQEAVLRARVEADRAAQDQQVRREQIATQAAVQVRNAETAARTKEEAKPTDDD